MIRKIQILSFRVRQQSAGFQWLIGLIIFFLLDSLSGQMHNISPKTRQLKLEKELESTGSLIDRTRDTKHITLTDIAILQSSIKSRQQLIQVYTEQQEHLYDTIFSKLLYVNTLNDNIDLLQQEYSRMIYAAYRQGGEENLLLQLLAAENLQQALNRFNWFRSYSEKRKEQVAAIEEMEGKYLAEVAQLSQKIEHNQQLISKLTTETEKLGQEIDYKDRSVAALAKKEQLLIRQYYQLRENSDFLKQQIEQSLDQESTAEKTSGSQPDAELVEQLSSQFENNRGKLPWPSEFGVVTTPFGEHQHPDFKKVKVKNNGINIVTTPGSQARAIFDGVVTRVMEVSNFNKVVIIRHGEYLTVYSNLSNVVVKPGDEMKTRQDIGAIYTDLVSDKTELHFELWKGKVLLDPLHWLTSQENSVQAY